MGEDLESLKHRLPLLDYLRQQNWTARPVGHGSEFRPCAAPVGRGTVGGQSIWLINNPSPGPTTKGGGVDRPRCKFPDDVLYLKQPEAVDFHRLSR